ncbi:LLM class flavin-dependent oxidoreductase [Gluconobacter wancherniae]|nr:LLM class flavin-dependent oxidoreductase [Gluconobacter wancherniae]MBF0854742.1 LLM class flavin-dependent oxidoreductase [Gluconobacter wancherniae]GBD57812.1 monooxygenase [Gluconobacter wancherniae NBRC 103581]GBR62006.1 monooxygenase-like protein [Gluconobacter wancherniae NBRC 103581]
MSAHMKLAAFLLPTGHHAAAWRHPGSAPDAGSNFQRQLDQAKLAERGLFDAVFIADFTSSIDEATMDGFKRMTYGASFEPITLLSALAATTSRIGLIGTVSTTYSIPYHLARQFLSLDQISNGRVGWNLVTTANTRESVHYGKTSHVPHADRYRQAREFAHIVQNFWDSWEDDAFLRDTDSGKFFSPEKRRPFHFEGEFLSASGQLDIPRSVQGRPVLVQAGSSEPGRALAAETAEMVFTAQQTLEEAKAFRFDLHRRMREIGRNPESLKVMPGVYPLVGRTQTEAEDLKAELDALTHPDVGLFLLGGMTGTDLRGLPLDGPLPEVPENFNGNRSRQSLLVEMAKRRNMSLRDLYLEVSGARGHWSIYGGPKQIADQLEEWFVEGAADGFNIMPPILPQSLETFVDLVVPELQKRGLFRKSYEGHTLREHLGLRRPASGEAP